MDLYSYYKVREADQSALHRAVTAMQAELTSAHGVAPQLKRRPQPGDGVWTWMEVYPDVRDGFDAVLADAVQKHGLPALTAGPRHTEIFTDI
ncbi:hypothetical protein GCM10027277_04490 [Pseudoduganella ginsengisoli]|uniref:DUF4936 family protein n=1 Tax=Pseudoduganella ginsengisoli TaxID=1462440 RepID=A0A6L6Q647_9BURK|nr:DUF4936 family protein [Pseudoduganella ginsengisoli]MTW04884.1 DUF4936 family protein [Pseudoduganella ginsengisoli]